MAITEQVIRESPIVSNWSFFDGIQPKGDYIISLYDSDMDIQTVDASTWKICARPIQNRFELKIEVNGTAHIDEDTETIAVDLLLTSLLGERQKIARILDFQIVDEFDEADFHLIQPIQNILDLLG